MIKLAECLAKSEGVRYAVYKVNGAYDFKKLTEAEFEQLRIVYVTV